MDNGILLALQNDARRPLRGLAADLGIAPSTCLQRVRGLQERRVITGFRADLNFEAIGRAVQAIIAVKIRPPSRDIIEKFRDWVAALPETIGVFVVSGDADFLIHVAVQDIQQLYGFVIDRLTERAELAEVRTSVVYDHLRKKTIEIGISSR